jgi:hypothetical protein
VIKGSQDSFPLEHPPLTSFLSSAPHPLAPPTYTVGVLSTVLHHPPQLIVFQKLLAKEFTCRRMRFENAPRKKVLSERHPKVKRRHVAGASQTSRLTLQCGYVGHHVHAITKSRYVRKTFVRLYSPLGMDCMSIWLYHLDSSMLLHILCT